MPMYRVFINGKDTGEYVTASSPEDAYFDVSAATPLKLSDNVQLEEIQSKASRPGLPAGRRTIPQSTTSVVEQELFIKKPKSTK